MNPPNELGYTIIVLLGFILCLLTGISSCAEGKKEIRNEAVSLGYAEWVETKNQFPSFIWVCPED